MNQTVCASPEKVSSFISQDKENNSPFIPITVEMYKQFSVAVYVILIPLLCTVGLIGNVTGLILLRKDANMQSSSFYSYMSALMGAHIARNVLSLINSIPQFAYVYDFYLGNYIEQHIRRQTIYFAKLLDTFSASVLFFMSLERLFALIRPITFKDKWFSRNPRLTLTLAFLTFAVWAIPFPSCCEIRSSLNSDNKTFYFLRERNTVWKNFMNIYVLVSSIIQYYFAPISILIVNIAIPIAYFRYQKVISQDELDFRRSSQQKKITSVVLSIGVLYLLMSVPSMFANTLDYIDEDYSFSGRYSHIYFFFTRLGTLLMHVNTACDCIVYIFVSKRFWLLFKRILCHCCFQKEKLTTNLNDSVCRTQTDECKVTVY